MRIEEGNNFTLLGNVFSILGEVFEKKITINKGIKDDFEVSTFLL